MKTVLRILALAFSTGALAAWLAGGANRGWSKTSVPVMKLDEVTGIEGIEYQKRFVPGVDFLGAAFLAAAVLGGTSILFQNRKHKT